MLEPEEQSIAAREARRFDRTGAPSSFARRRCMSSRCFQDVLHLLRGLVVLSYAGLYVSARSQKRRSRSSCLHHPMASSPVDSFISTTLLPTPAQTHAANHDHPTAVGITATAAAAAPPLQRQQQKLELQQQQSCPTTMPPAETSPSSLHLDSYHNPAPHPPPAALQAQLQPKYVQLVAKLYVTSICLSCVFVACSRWVQCWDGMD